MEAAKSAENISSSSASTSSPNDTHQDNDQEENCKVCPKAQNILKQNPRQITQFFAQQTKMQADHQRGQKQPRTLQEREAHQPQLLPNGNPPKPQPQQQNNPNQRPQLEPNMRVLEEKSKASTEVRQECPPDSEVLGRSSWVLLHTMAAYYPRKPSTDQRDQMKSFISNLSVFYPCNVCGEHLQDYLKAKPPQTESRQAFSNWMCEYHNDVNRITGKPLFDCSLVAKRWREGPDDGSCD